MAVKEKTGSISAVQQYAASGANAITGTLGIAGTIASEGGSMSAFVNAFHDAGDALSYWTQGQRTRKHESFSAGRHDTYKKIGHWAIFGTSMAAGVKSAYDVGRSIAGTIEVTPPSPASVAAAMGSLAFAGGLAYASDRKIRQRQARMDDPHRTDAEKDWMKHVLWMDVPSSAMAVAGVAAQSAATPGGTMTEQMLGLGSAAWGMYLFRPTKENLEHDHASHQPDEHGHVAHDHHGHGHGGHETLDTHDAAHDHSHALGQVAMREMSLSHIEWGLQAPVGDAAFDAAFDELLEHAELVASK